MPVSQRRGHLSRDLEAERRTQTEEGRGGFSHLLSQPSSLPGISTVSKMFSAFCLFCFFPKGPENQMR